MHVVLGANGRAGGETANALIARGEKVRVVVRRAEQGQRWRARGAEIALASIDDVAAMAAAFAGADSAFLLSPPPVDGDPFARAETLGATLAKAVQATRLPKLVLLSSVGAQHPSGTGVIATLNRMETALAGAAPATAFLRSGYFVETWSEVASAAAEGILPSFLAPDLKIPMVSTIDVGAAAAQLMSDPWSGHRIVELGGPAEWSAADVAAAFADALGRPVAPSLVPREARVPMLIEAGVSPEVAEALAGMYDGLASGRVARENGTEHWRGTTPLSGAVERIVGALTPTA
jgi:uncharacterized protein YbjT (DUF2867 family)